MRFRRRRKRPAPGEFSEHVTRAYVRQTLPSATPAEARRTVEHLRGKGWDDEKLSQYVLPYMPRGASPVQPGEPVYVPVPVSRQWLNEELPTFDREQIQHVVEELERRGWSARDVAVAVLPHLLRKLPDDDALAVLAAAKRLGLRDDEVARLARRG